MKPIRLALTGAFALGVAATATASAGEWAAKFAQMDADADGEVTLGEFTAYRGDKSGMTETEIGERFAALAGPDGRLTLVEYEAFMAVSEDAAAKAQTEDTVSPDEGR